MQPPLNDEELERLYPHLHPDERNELEGWHRGWITKMFMGEATQEEYDAAIPPYPDPLLESPLITKKLLLSLHLKLS